MKTPAFWQQQDWKSTLVLPLATLYETSAVLNRAMAKPVTLPIPVICVGNLTAGGSGKTPVALAIGQILKDRNIRAFFLSRGYGGNAKQAMRVENKHTAREVGDEAILLSRVLPTVVAKDRLEGARRAIALGAELIVMDDGFQNYLFHKTLSLIVIDGVAGFGNGRLLPAGPLRESAALAYKRAHAVVIVNPTQFAPAIPEGKPTLLARTVAQGGDELKGKPVVAFCGLGNPAKFEATLASLGANVQQFIAFEDHHDYSEHDLKKLSGAARQYGARLVTTAKDAVKLPADFKSIVSVVEIALEWDNPELLATLLDYVCEAV